MSAHIADTNAQRPTPHHYMNADGFCHAGDMFEQGARHTVLYSADELVRIVNAEKAEAWDEGREVGQTFWGKFRDNPYRVTEES